LVGTEDHVGREIFRLRSFVWTVIRLIDVIFLMLARQIILIIKIKKITVQTQRHSAMLPSHSRNRPFALQSTHFDFWQSLPNFVKPPNENAMYPGNLPFRYTDLYFATATVRGQGEVALGLKKDPGAAGNHTKGLVAHGEVGWDGRPRGAEKLFRGLPAQPAEILGTKLKLSRQHALGLELGGFEVGQLRASGALRLDNFALVGLVGTEDHARRNLLLLTAALSGSVFLGQTLYGFEPYKTRQAVYLNPQSRICRSLRVAHSVLPN